MKKCFYGAEAEGPGKGKMTLFVPNGAINSDNVKMYTSIRFLRFLIRKNIFRVYFGAGNERGINEYDLKLVDMLYYTFYNFRFLAELDQRSLNKLPNNDNLSLVSLIFVVDTNVDLKHNLKFKHLKLVNKEMLNWYVLPQSPFVTHVNDCNYLTDKEINEFD